jgi:hypothetical protein
MRRYLGAVFVVALAVTATPGQANGLLGGLPAVPALGGGGGASFAATGTQMQGQVLVGLRTLVAAVALMQEALGHKAAADKLKAISDELKNEKETKSDDVEQTLKAIDDNPVDRDQLAAVKDAKSKQLLVQSAGNMAVAGIYNAKAVETAKQLAGLRPGPADALSAPSLFDTAKTVVTALPAEIQHAVTYSGMLSDYMTTNKLTPPSKDDQRKLAVANGADEAQVAAALGADAK